MRDFYTYKDICVYPGFNSVVIKKACEAIGIDLKAEGRVRRQHGRDVDAFTREEFMKILQHHGFEFVQIDGNDYWVRYKTPDM